MQFMRKVRKSSRIHDDLPVATTSQVSIQQVSICEEAEDPAPRPSCLSASEAQQDDQQITCTATLDDAAGLDDARGATVQRSRSLTAGRPSLQIPGGVSRAESPASLSPVVFSLPDGSRYETGCSPNSSVSSLLFPTSEQSPVRENAAPPPNYPRPRKALLDITLSAFAASPSSLASTPSVLTPSPAPSPLPSQTFSKSPMPSRSASLRGPREGLTLKRRLSLDLHNIAQALPSPRLSPPLAKSTRTAKARRVLRKARSIARLSDVVREGNKTPPPCVLPLPQLDSSMLDEGQETEPQEQQESSGQISEKQRLLAIKRARKLTKLFGDELPLSLAQFANAPVDAPVDDLSAMVINARSKRRDSRASFISDTLSSVAQARFRDSVLDHSEPSSPAVDDDDDESIDVKQSLEGIQEVEVPLSPLSSGLDSPIVPNTAPATPSGGARPFFTRSAASDARSLRGQQSDPELRSQHRKSLPPPPPRTPPPFSNLFVMPAEAEAVTEKRGRATHIDPQDDFRARRLRAEKLSRFFGVDTKDLQEALPRPSSVSRSDVRPQNPGLVALLTRGIRDVSPSPRKESTSTEVAAEVVAAKSRFRIGRYNQNVTKEMDMHEVIDQLRKMK